MKQLLVKKGQILSEDLPSPALQEGTVKIQVLYSCISAGTELSNVSTSGKGILQRVIEKPEVVMRSVIKISKLGIKEYWNSVKAELNQAQPSGYSLAGTVIEVAPDIDSFKIGDLVAAGGVGASHAEIAVVPKNLVVAIPQTVSPKHASTVAIGSIALQGIRRAKLEFGANVAVIGTGLLGLITIQLLKAAGMRVTGIDVNRERLKVAQKCGADSTYLSDNETLIEDITRWADGQGVDAAIITASSNSDEPLSQAFQMCRKKGAVVLVGVTGMQVNRKDIYQKELDFFISTSYGPGRYDEQYENQGVDYPYGYVRWTENRNMQAYLRALASNGVNLNLMSQAEFDLSEAESAFRAIGENDAPLLSFFKYPNEDSYTSAPAQPANQGLILKGSHIRTAVIGTGSFASSMTIPILKKFPDLFSIDVLVNQTPYKAKNVANQFDIKSIESNIDDLLAKHDIDAVFITTRHGNHADLALKCLQAGKHVFLEKPLAVNSDQLRKIEHFFTTAQNPPVLTVGFNRRFSPYAKSIKQAIANRTNPLSIYYRMNAGFQAEDHWTHQDGGRIIGEACHIIDLFGYLTDSEPISVSIDAVTSKTPGILSSDNRTITIPYEDGSVCTLLYTAQGNNNLSKEYMEIHFDQKSIVLDNYSSLKGFGLKLPARFEPGDKGHTAIIEAFGNSIKEEKAWPIPLSAMLSTSQAAIQSSN